MSKGIMFYTIIPVKPTAHPAHLLSFQAKTSKRLKVTALYILIWTFLCDVKLLTPGAVPGAVPEAIRVLVLPALTIICQRLWGGLERTMRMWIPPVKSIMASAGVPASMSVYEPQTLKKRNK